MRDKLLIEIYRIGSADALGEAQEDQIKAALGINRDDLVRLAGQLEQLGHLTYLGVSAGSFKLTASGIREAERLLPRTP